MFRDRLKAHYLKATAPGEEEGLAVALSASAAPEQAGELEALLNSPRGETRIHFIRTLLQVGGERDREVIKSLQNDPLFGREVNAALKGRSMRA